MRTRLGVGCSANIRDLLFLLFFNGKQKETLTLTLRKLYLGDGRSRQPPSCISPQQPTMYVVKIVGDCLITILFLDYS